MTQELSHHVRLTSLGVTGHSRRLKVAALATKGAKAVAAVMAAVAHE